MKKTSSKSTDPLRPHSAEVLDGPKRAPSRSMLYPVGFKPEDFQKPIIGSINGAAAGARDTLFFSSGPHTWRGATEVSVRGLFGSVTPA